MSIQLPTFLRAAAPSPIPVRPAGQPFLPRFLRDQYAASPRPAAQVPAPRPVSALSLPGLFPVALTDGGAPDPKALRRAILDYRNAVLGANPQSVHAPMMANLYCAGGNNSLMMLPGLVLPHGARVLSQAWLGREPRPDELARFEQLARTQGPEAVIEDIGNRGLVARLKRTDGSAQAIAAIRSQVAAMVQWQPGDAFGTDDAKVPAIPPGPALDPVRSPNGPAAVGTPHKDRAGSPEARRQLRAAIDAYSRAIDDISVRNSDMMVLTMAGRLSGNQVFLLPGLMLPHGAHMMMLAWLGREATPAELARWQAMDTNQAGQQGFAAILGDIERTALAARLPETDGSGQAIAAMRQEVGARMTWR